MGGDRVQYFARAAEHRLIAAEVLLRNAMDAYPTLLLDAVYLGGYAVECSLKAVILSRIPEPERDAYEKQHFRGRDGHKLEALHDKLVSHGARPPSDVMRRIHALRWHSELRYEAGAMKFKEADALRFCRDAVEIVRWMKRSM
ncbi:MAG: hypothetical protein WD118_04075 [Phycisphaeraceae bacterium]